MMGIKMGEMKVEMVLYIKKGSLTIKEDITCPLHVIMGRGKGSTNIGF